MVYNISNLPKFILTPDCLRTKIVLVTRLVYFVSETILSNISRAVLYEPRTSTDHLRVDHLSSGLGPRHNFRTTDTISSLLADTDPDFDPLTCPEDLYRLRSFVQRSFPNPNPNLTT